MSLLAQKYQLSAPIVQAPMAGVSTVELATAVTRAGGIGSLGLGHLDIETARAHIQALKLATDGPINVNFFCHQPETQNLERELHWLYLLTPYFNEFDSAPPSSLAKGYDSAWQNPALIQMLCEEKPTIVSFHFGLPEPSAIIQLKAAGIDIWGCATSLAEAKFLEQSGVDAIIAQGIEAGGHRGLFNPLIESELSLTSLLGQLHQHIHLPLIAAGGVMTGAQVAAVQLQGADLAQLGTAFIACPESAADSAYRAALLSQRAYDTAITPVISGRPARGLRNRMHTEIAALIAALPAYPVAYNAAKALHQVASAAENYDFAAHWAGQGAPLARALPATDLFNQLRTEYIHAKQRLEA